MSGNLNGAGGRQNRRNFLKTGFAATGAAVGAAGVAQRHGRVAAASRGAALHAGGLRDLAGRRRQACRTGTGCRERRGSLAAAS